METRNLSSALWSHQHAAIEVIDRYICRPRYDGRSVLITMPTGTGKSAVIAGAIEKLSGRLTAKTKKKHVLIVAPWRGIVDQLSRDLNKRIWAHLEVERPSGFPQVQDLPAAREIESLRQRQNATVFVATTAKILQIYSRPGMTDQGMAQLFSSFAAVFVDEGHYEPAPRWSQAIRSITRPTILLTATPYRNDDKYFNVNPTYQHRYEHWRAVNEGFLRSPDFVRVSDGEQDTFAAEFIKLFNDKRTVHPDTRAIVRCSESSQIRELVAMLRSSPHGKSAIGIHETFATDPQAGLYRYVPNPEKTKADIWVHQFKLVEGLDDPRFRILAFYEGLGNDRATIQQIGRVLRNPQKSRTDATAWVMYRSGFDVNEIWENYKHFDRTTGEEHGTRQNLVDELISIAPTSIYDGGRFRVPLNLDASDAWRHLKYPLAARIFRPGTKLDLVMIADKIEAEWKLTDRRIQTRLHPSEDCVVVQFVTITNSPFLRTAAFTEARYGYTVLRHTGKNLFVFDTEGRTPECLKVLPLESPTRLSRLLDGNSRLTTVSLANTDLGRRSIRARTIRAAAIDDLAPDLADYAYVCSVAEGYPDATEDKDRFRRYVGMSRSRLRDTGDSSNTFTAFVDWSETIARQLNRRTVAADTFRRYADTSKVPLDKTPRHVLLDVIASDFDRPGTGIARHELILDDYASEVRNGVGKIKVSQEDIQFQLVWDTDRKRYHFSCPRLERLDYRERSVPHRGLVSVINGDQRFRIVTATDGFTYTNGHFTQPIRPDSDEDRFWLLDALTPMAELEHATSEKGIRRLGDEWEAGSVFSLIDNIRKPGASVGPSAKLAKHFDKLDALLCGDLRSEIADFIAVQPDRIAFIHAKADKGRILAPAALHEVISQATKNLLWLQPLNNDLPAAATREWNDPWKLTDKTTAVTQLVNRQRLGTFTDGQAFWKHARSVIRNPNADREVWLVLGGALSLSAVRNAVTNPTPELIQLYALLQSAWTATSQVGIRLRVFCSP